MIGVRAVHTACGGLLGPTQAWEAGDDEHPDEHEREQGERAFVELLQLLRFHDAIDGAAGDEVERLGIERSWEAIGDADVIVFLHDLTRRGDADYEAAESEIARKLPVGLPRLDVDNKADLVSTGPVEGLGRLRLSTRTGDGLEALREALLAIVGWQAMPEGTFIARTRHVQAIRTAQQHLERAAQHAAQRDEALELFAEELRLAHAALAGVTGEITADDLLGEIFGRFCIGK